MADPSSSGGVGAATITAIAALITSVTGAISAAIAGIVTLRKINKEKLDAVAIAEEVKKLLAEQERRDNA